MHHPSFGWRKLCWDYLSSTRCEVLCRHLGYTRLKDMKSRREFGRLAAIYPDDIQCTGSGIPLRTSGEKFRGCTSRDFTFVSCY